jgi:ubiquinone biosynthesis protein Coq4
MAMTRWETFRALRRAMREGRIADVAVYKGELAGGHARPWIEAALAGMAQTFPRIDVDALRRLPPGTLGRDYVDLLAANGLEPFVLSDEIDTELLQRNIFIARYGLVHDMFHVLTGFDTSWAGEMGVWAFVAAQRYAWAHVLAVLLACIVYPLRAPLQIPRLWNHLWLGLRMGRAARTLITVELETMLDRNVDDLRRELRILPRPQSRSPHPVTTTPCT